MKKYLIIALFVLTCCSSGKEIDEGFLFYTNMDSFGRDYTEWVVKTYDHSISIGSFNKMRIESLDLCDYPFVESEDDKDCLYTLFSLSQWMSASIIGDELTRNPEHWLWFNKHCMRNSIIHSLGKIGFCDSFESYLFAYHSFDPFYNLIKLYAVNVKNGLVVSVVELNHLHTSCGDYGDFKTDVSYYPRKRKCVLCSTHEGIFMEEQHTTKSCTSFVFSPEGKIIWENNNN